MIDMVQQILNITLFSGSEQPFIMMPSGTVDPPQALLPDNCHLEMSSHSASTYLTTLWNLLEAHQPACLFLIPPLIAAEDLPQKVKAQYPELDLPDIALNLALDKVPAGCRLGMLMPHGFLLNVRSQALREQVNQTATPRFVIEFDFDAGQIIGNIPDEVSLHLIVIETGQAEDRLVRFFRCPDIPPHISADGTVIIDDKRQNAVLGDLTWLTNRGGGSGEFGYILRDGIPANTPWLYDRHHPNYRRQVEDLGHFGQVRPLGDLVEMWFGFHATEQVNLLIPSRESQKGIPVIEARDIGQNTLAYDDTRHRILPEKSGEFQLQPNDICLRGEIAQDQPLRVVRIENQMLPLAASNSVLVLRPKPEVNLDVSFLVAYLQSTNIIDLLRAQGVAQRLYPQTLREVPVPVQDEELQATLRDIRAAAHSMSVWQAEAESTIHSLFNFESALEARVHVLAVGRRIRQRERAAQQIDALSYRLRTGLPYPLAYRWRMVETTQPTLEGYRDILECAETVACYLALVALVMMRAVGESINYLDSMSERLTNLGHGTNFGDWLAILREAQGNKSLKRMSPVPFYETARVLDDEVVDQAVSLLKKNRDDNSHGRGPHGPEIPEKIEESLTALRIFLEATEFIAEYPLRYVEETHRDSIAGITTYRYRSIIGDHAIVGIEESHTNMAELEAHSLYLVDRSGELHLIRPFLIRQECPTCKSWEIFYLDSFKATGDTCELKSMTTGHTLSDNKISNVFRHVGILM